MKTILITMMLAVGTGSATAQSEATQTLFSLGYSTTGQGYLDAGVIHNDRLFLLYLGSTNNDSRGKLVDEQLPNHGRVVDKTVTTSTSLGIGYGFKARDRLWLVAVGGYNERNTYTSYFDDRFSGGGYHMKTGSKPGIEVGVRAVIDSDPIIFGVGINSINGLVISVGMNMKL